MARTTLRDGGSRHLGDIGEEEEEIEVAPMPHEVPVPEPSPAPEEVPA